MQTAFDELRQLYLEKRHYGDEYKAFHPEPYFRYLKVLYHTFQSMYLVDTETGNVMVRNGLDAQRCRKLKEDLLEAEKFLIPLHDPKEDKIDLWEGENMPWHLISKEEWPRISHDGADFRPHLIPFLHNDGKIHPTVVITGGSFRYHMTEGFPVAEFYYAHGYNAFILNNRHAIGEKIRMSLIRSLDLQRAIRLIRARAGEFGVDTQRIFTNGFSMGNRPTINLINDLGFTTSPQEIDPAYFPDVIDAQSARLNAYVAVYPATFPYDNHNNYRDFPPTFAIMGNRDWSLWRMMPFVSDLASHGVRVEAHLYDGAEHGFALADDSAPPPHTDSLREWPQLLLRWLNRVLT